VTKRNNHKKTEAYGIKLRVVENIFPGGIIFKAAKVEVFVILPNLFLGQNE
jgi:hypothetical protein